MLAAAIQLIKKNFYFLAGKSIPFEYLVCALRLVIYFVTFQISLQNLNCKISEFFFVVLNPEVVQHFSTLLFYVPHSYNTHFLAVCDLGNFINISLKICFSHYSLSQWYPCTTKVYLYLIQYNVPHSLCGTTYGIVYCSISIES